MSLPRVQFILLLSLAFTISLAGGQMQPCVYVSDCLDLPTATQSLTCYAGECRFCEAMAGDFVPEHTVPFGTFGCAAVCQGPGTGGDIQCRKQYSETAICLALNGSAAYPHAWEVYKTVHGVNHFHGVCNPCDNVEVPYSPECASSPRLPTPASSRGPFLTPAPSPLGWSLSSPPPPLETSPASTPSPSPTEASKQACNITYDCGPDLQPESSVTCYNGTCIRCNNTDAGSGGLALPVPPELGSGCSSSCAGPGQDGDQQCEGYYPGTNKLCFPLFWHDGGYSSYSQVSIASVLDPMNYPGVCVRCPFGSFPNSNRTRCVTSPDAAPSLAPAPHESTSLSPTPSPLSLAPAPHESTSPGPAPTSQSIPITSASSSSSSKHQSIFNAIWGSWFRAVIVSAAGALITGVIGLLFYFGQSAYVMRLARRKYPLADFIRRKLGLKTVSNFECNSGLQFRATVEILSEALDSRNFLKHTALLGPATSSLASAIASVLQKRYISTPERDEKEFLVLFANECSNKTGISVLASDIEAMVTSNQGWYDLLVPAPSVPNPPTPPSLGFGAAAYYHPRSAPP